MRKIVTLFLLIIIAGGCSVFKNSSKIIPDIPAEINENVLQSTEYQNITNSGFYIQKAEIETVSSQGNDKFIAIIKFEKPDKYLISLRSRTGIEGVRIFISGDSVQVNDRINRKLYYGTSIYLQRKYGFSQSSLPLFFGDILLNEKCDSSQEKCFEDKLNLVCQHAGIPFNFSIDCKMRKLIKVDQISDFNKDGISMKYGKYFKAGNILIPGIIEFDDSKYSIAIKIKVLKVQSPWIGKIDFIPGKGYELIELL